ncbi:hypothetical protein Ait01nite_018150 [Actinoplanes italicus]|uniref:Uncharacterized protein n=1 Tax=Actinoplanes italicus TaxID=113567 RepID=A0A2T0KPX2_9ACTN|nr:hypothetical protein [Actinoplanes italicus]PRX25779.1 hypothetical protein CLV67_101499 [Actinoplanes italicus]GIE28770.1 hypothetical protein Ait01nite_018150 [Actinoplanes italicus]
MKIRRADKHYEPRHGGTGDRLAGVAPVAVVTIGIAVSLVTSFLFRDDVALAAEHVVGDRPAALVLAGWSFVAVTVIVIVVSVVSLAVVLTFGGVP